MQATIHVWKWKSNNEFFIRTCSWLLWCIHFVNTFRGPFFLHIAFDFLQKFYFERSFSFNSRLSTIFINKIMYLVVDDDCQPYNWKEYYHFLLIFKIVHWERINTRSISRKLRSLLVVIVRVQIPIV